MRKIVVSFRGSPYGPDSLKTDTSIQGVLGLFNSVAEGYKVANEHMENWIKSYRDNNIGMRPIIPYGCITWNDPTTVEMGASGGWGESIGIRYKFEYQN